MIPLTGLDQLSTQYFPSVAICATSFPGVAPVRADTIIIDPQTFWHTNIPVC